MFVLRADGFMILKHVSRTFVQCSPFCKGMSSISVLFEDMNMNTIRPPPTCEPCVYYNLMNKLLLLIEAFGPAISRAQRKEIL